jgi:hypothetical protein
MGFLFRLHSLNFIWPCVNHKPHPKTTSAQKAVRLCSPGCFETQEIFPHPTKKAKNRPGFKAGAVEGEVLVGRAALRIFLRRVTGQGP